MKITKFVHSCLLVETPERVAVFNPGQFSWDSGIFTIDALTRLDDIVITHEHGDHMSIAFIKALVTKFPKARITTTQDAAKQLADAGLNNVVTESSDGIELFATNHESTEPLGPTPQNIGVHYLDLLTDPGDSHTFDQTKKILALPVTAPWGTVMRAAQLGAELTPKYIIPIHDWHWSSEARAIFYDRLEAFFKDKGITFIKAVDGEVIELDEE